MDRAFDLLVRYRGAVLWCLLPAIVLRFIALVLFPGSVPVTSTSEELINDYVRKGLLFDSARIVDSFSLWFCSAALIVGVRCVTAGDAPHPLRWLLLTWRRLSALLAIFIPYVLPQILGAALRTQIVTIGYTTFITYEASATLFSYLVSPLLGLILAGVILENVGVRESLAIVVRTCLSLGRLRRFLTLSAATVLVCLLMAFALSAIHVFVTLKLHDAALVWQVAWAVLGPATTAYTAFIVAVAWLSGYIGPRTRPVQKPSD